MDNNMTQQFTQEDIEATKGLAWLSYLGIFFLIPMLVNKDSAYTKFHVNQGIVLCIIVFALGIITAIPFIGLIGLLAYPVALVFAIMGIVNACQGQAKPLPLIGSIQIYK